MAASFSDRRLACEAGRSGHARAAKLRAERGAADAFQRGYDLVWVTDALQAFTDEAHRQGLEYLTSWYASDPPRQPRTADQVIAEWEGAKGGARARQVA